MDIRIKPSKSGKTYSIEFRFKSKDSEHPDMAINGCKIAHGANGSFNTGPSWKGDDGKFNNYCYFGKDLNAKLTELAEKATQQKSPPAFNGDTESDIPF